MASRKDEKEQRRAERLARESQEAEQARRRRLYSIVVGGVLVIAVIAAGVIILTGGGDDGASSAGHVPAGEASYDGPADPPQQQAMDLVQAARTAGCRLSNPVIEGRNHIGPDTKITYKTNPATSGNHDPQPAGDGVYSKPATATDIRHFLHTLEHGRVAIQYDPSLPKAQVDRLGGLYQEDPYHMVLFPNRKIPYQVAGAAWGHLVGCKKLTDETFDALRAFRDRYRDQGPEQVP